MLEGSNISALSLLFSSFLVLTLISRRATGIVLAFIPGFASSPAGRLPGPTQLPILGNAHQMPNERHWLKFDEWLKRYGDLVFLKIFRQPTLVIGSAQVAFDLLDTRGAIYSDRPPATMVAELTGWNKVLGFTRGPPNSRFRDFRRVFHQSIGSHAYENADTQEILQGETRKFVFSLMNEKGKSFADACHGTTSSMVLRLMYGYEAKDTADPFVEIAETAMAGFVKSVEPGLLIDLLPSSFLKYIPEWALSVTFQTTTQAYRRDLDKLREIPHAFVKKQIAAGMAKPSFISMCLTEGTTGNDGPTPEREEFAKVAAASFYAGAFEATPSMIKSFILAMTLYPDIQARAQQELDAVLGGIDSNEHRLPTLADRRKLPYITAIMKEIWRWNSPVTISLPHMLTQDDTYRGCRIEKGTAVYANIWTMLHDPNVFPDPFTFKPERFLDQATGQLRKLNKVEDPAHISFGFGRRICPGFNLIDASVFLNIATILYTLRISKARAPDGSEIIPTIDYSGLVCQPRPFKCNIDARSQEMETLLSMSLESWNVMNE